MCRLLGYVGTPVQLDLLFCKPDHSLIVQSYQPREMTAGLLNADGFGIGWYHVQRATFPYTYRNTQPIWSDANLPSLTRYIESGYVVASVRSATEGLAVDLSNCQPFQYGSILGVHNGFIANFRQTLYRPMREQLCDVAYQAIHGLTDSEHIFALLIDEMETVSHLSLTDALQRMLIRLMRLSQQYRTDFSANLILSDGKDLVASRFASRDPVPTLYWLRDDPLFPDAVLVASEPLFKGNWMPLPDRSILTIYHDLDFQIYPL